MFRKFGTKPGYKFDEIQNMVPQLIIEACTYKGWENYDQSKSFIDEKMHGEIFNGMMPDFSVRRFDKKNIKPENILRNQWKFLGEP